MTLASGAANRSVRTPVKRPKFAKLNTLKALIEGSMVKRSLIRIGQLRPC